MQQAVPSSSGRLTPCMRQTAQHLPVSAPSRAHQRGSLYHQQQQQQRSLLQVQRSGTACRLRCSASSQPEPGDNNSSNRPRPKNKGAASKVSRVEAFMRTTPVLNLFVDGTLLLGDIVMVLATEVSSDRLQYEEMPSLTIVTLLSWLVAATGRGDYAAIPDPDENPLSNAMGWPVMQAIINACVTWALCVLVAIFGYAFLISHFMVEPTTVLDTVAHDGVLAPQMEVCMGLLITMACWRGIAARLRL